MRTSNFIATLLILSTVFVPDGLTQFKSLKPLYHGDRIKISVSEGNNSVPYYMLLKDNPSYLLVKGPGILRVVTRALIKSGDYTKEHSLFYRIDGSNPVKHSSVPEPGKFSAKKVNSGKPGILKNLDIELGPGEHSLEFTSSNDGTSIIARYLFKRKKTQNIRWVMLSPSRPNEPVDLVTHENVVHYHRFTQKKPLRIRINGPTTLRVLTRFEVNYEMKGRIDYRVQVKEDGKVIHTYLLSSIYSEVTNYKKNKKLIPGKGREFYIQVPSGLHNYTIVPLDKDKNTILARLLIPKKDVKLEE